MCIYIYAYIVYIYVYNIYIYATYLYALDRTEYWLLDLDPGADLVSNSAVRMRRNKRMPSILNGFSDNAPRFTGNLERNSKHLQLLVSIII